MAIILVVDDLAANRELLVTLLRYKGHRLLEAAHGADALDVVRHDRPDLVITDVLMPVMDGYEFVRRLRLLPGHQATPVIFYTAHYGEREARVLAEASGVTHVLTKPAEPESVLNVVETVLRGDQPSDASPSSQLTASDFDREHLRLLTDKLSETTDDLKGANARLRALINIGLELASQRDTSRLLQELCTASRDLFGATYVTIGVVDRDHMVIDQHLTDGVADLEWIRAGDPVPAGITTVIRDGRTVRGETASGLPAELGLPDHHPPMHAYLFAPLASPAHHYGWICLVNNEGRVFTQEDEHLVRALAGQAGRVYENGYFYSIAERRAEALEREVAERKRAESAVRHERDRAERFLNTAEVILLALDDKGRITLVNRYATQVLGWTTDELLGRDWVEMCLPPRTHESARRKWHDVLRGDLTVAEYTILTKSGEERYVEWRNTLLRDEAGNVVGTFSSGTDITERNRALKALRVAEERMRFALESAEVGIWDADYRTGIVAWSETLETIFGLDPGTFEGSFQHFVDRIHPEDRDSVLATIAAAMKSGTDFTIEHRIVRPDGKLCWLTGAGRIHLDREGHPVRGVGIAIDRTERRKLEQQYQQAQKMEAVGRLAGGIAHDFNNLLTAILGYCELLLADLSADDPHRQDVAEIHKAGRSAAGLTRQLLAFSRKQIIQPNLLDLNLVVSDMRPMLDRIIGEDVRIVLKLVPDLALVLADRGQIEQILLNLAVNARDAMPKGGILTIETSNALLDDEYARLNIGVRPGPHVVLTVTDTGTGMTPDVQSRLFEPFFTTKEPGKGTGLGLATVHGIVESSGGSVHVYSEVGRGTAFKVYLPAAEGEALEFAAAPALEPIKPGEYRILVVDDAEGLRELARRLLERQGYEVLVAATAEEARSVFEQGIHVDVILTDVVMPGGSGPDLTSELKQAHPALRVIYMSGYTEEAIVQHGVLLPGIAFLHKPFTSEEIGRKVLEVLGRQAGS